MSRYTSIKRASATPLDLDVVDKGLVADALVLRFLGAASPWTLAKNNATASRLAGNRIIPLTQQTSGAGGFFDNHPAFTCSYQFQCLATGHGKTIGFVILPESRGGIVAIHGDLQVLQLNADF